MQGARVLDLASHDGRWSFAALKAGAAHVTGVEARPQLVEKANKTFAEYGVPTDQYDWPTLLATSRRAGPFVTITWATG